MEKKIWLIQGHGWMDKNFSGIASHKDVGGQVIYLRDLTRALNCCNGIKATLIAPSWNRKIYTEKVILGKSRFNIVHIPYGSIPKLMAVPHELKNIPDKEDLWPHLGTFVGNLFKYGKTAGFPDAIFAHYAESGLLTLLFQKILIERGYKPIPIAFTAHSLFNAKAFRLRITDERGKALPNLSLKYLTEMCKNYNLELRATAEMIIMKFYKNFLASSMLEWNEQYQSPVYGSSVTNLTDDKVTIALPGINRNIFSPDPTEVYYDKERITHENIKKAIQASKVPLHRLRYPALILSSRLVPEKNPQFIIDIFSSSNQLKEKVNIIIGTRGFHEKNPMEVYEKKEDSSFICELIKKIKNNKLNGKVMFVNLEGQDQLSGLYRYYSQIPGSFFVLPTKFEPFGLAPFEAISTGLPVLISKRAGAREKLFDIEKCAYIIDPRNHESSKETIKKAIKNTKKWFELKFRGLNLARELTWESTAKKYLERMNFMIKKPIQEEYYKKLVIPKYFSSKQLLTHGIERNYSPQKSILTIEEIWKRINIKKI
jgi:sucrose-phosphate synthase